MHETLSSIPSWDGVAGAGGSLESRSLEPQSGQHSEAPTQTKQNKTLL
jgi:hypothetical protein